MLIMLFLFSIYKKKIKYKDNNKREIEKNNLSNLS